MVLPEQAKAHTLLAQLSRCLCTPVLPAQTCNSLKLESWTQALLYDMLPGTLLLSRGQAFACSLHQCKKCLLAGLLLSVIHGDMHSAIYLVAVLILLILSLVCLLYLLPSNKTGR